MKKNLVVLVIASVGLLSCGAEVEESTEVEELSPMMELAAETNFGFAMAQWGLYVFQCSDGMHDRSEVNDAKDIVIEKLESVVDEFKPSVYVDSANIYIDSVNVYYEKWELLNETSRLERGM